MLSLGRSFAVVFGLCASGFGHAEPPKLGGSFSQAVAQSPQPAISDFESYQFDGLRGLKIKEALSSPLGDRASLSTRGVHDAEIYRRTSPAVVIVLTTDGLGSGVFLGANRIVTNWHVVRGYKTVGVIFKPSVEGVAPSGSDVVQANVLRIDSTKDLALLAVASAPSTTPSLSLGTEKDIQIGADVHAIGHPTGEMWTYTKGLISQIRRDYEWKAEGAHKANVIQTQTPINPGNSGGPLIADNGKLVGINSFRTANSEGLNFAVSIDEVQRFLDAQTTISAPATECKTRQLYKGRNKDNDGQLIQYDTNCDGRIDFELHAPDNAQQPWQALIDSNFDSKIDIIVNDADRDGRWDISYHDVDFDGVIDLVGYHSDGKLKPTRYEKYVAQR